jgi:hypothetical protein
VSNAAGDPARGACICGGSLRRAHDASIFDKLSMHNEAFYRPEYHELSLEICSSTRITAASEMLKAQALIVGAILAPSPSLMSKQRKKERERK